MLLGRYKKEKLVEKGEEYTLYQVKDVVSGERVYAKLQYEGEESRSVLREAGFLQSMQGYLSFPLMVWYACCDVGVENLATSYVCYSLKHSDQISNNLCREILKNTFH